jgi:hypothetical protein
VVLSRIYGNTYENNNIFFGSLAKKKKKKKKKKGQWSYKELYNDASDEKIKKALLNSFETKIT